MKPKVDEKAMFASHQGEDASFLPTFVVPGWGAPAWHTRWIARELRGHGLTVVELKFPLMGVGDMNDSARKLSGEVERVCDELGIERVNLVGYSMGGTIVRVYLQKSGGAARLGRAVFVGAPMDGVYTGYAALHTTGGRQVRKGCSFMRDLQDGACRCESRRCLSIYLTHDIIISPSRSAHLPCAYNLELVWPVFHWGLVFSRHVVAAAAGFLKGNLPVGAVPGDRATVLS